MAILMAVAVLFAGRPAAAQQALLRYTAQQLDCARFLEIGESRIVTQTEGRTRRQTSVRRGTWQFRATPSDSGAVLEGWLDSLTITRRSEEAAISPDTDGLLGGRYRGTLSPRGDYTPLAHPFVPDEVAEVAGMAPALDDFFPRLAGRPLGVGELWTDSAGLTISRLTDSAMSGVPLHRFEVERRAEAQAAPSVVDTVPIELEQKSVERGQFVWHPVIGLVRRSRTIVVETTVPASRTVRQTVRSKLEQRITLTRSLGPSSCSRSGGR